jgi:hypothetical protein
MAMYTHSQLNVSMVANTYNPSYSGGRDQKDQSQPRQIVTETLSQKKPITKKGWWSGSR